MLPIGSVGIPMAASIDGATWPINHESNICPANPRKALASGSDRSSQGAPAPFDPQRAGRSTDVYMVLSPISCQIRGNLHISDASTTKR
ncbi:hypothetical protein Skr01_53590 [Sphaerisporangium krabiense]|nr:hypothetical protein Skr01_53590 [Sphaerisporangium krabiense]